MWCWCAPVLKRISSSNKWPNLSFIASVMRGSLAFTWHLHCHTQLKNFDGWTGLLFLVYPSKRRVTQWKRKQRRLQKRLRWNSVNTATCGPWKFIRIDGSKAYHSLVLHTCALWLHQLTQFADQTEEKASKLTNKWPPRTGWRPREQLHNYSYLDPFWLIKTYN